MAKKLPEFVTVRPVDLIQRLYSAYCYGAIVGILGEEQDTSSVIPMKEGGRGSEVDAYIRSLAERLASKKKRKDGSIPIPDVTEAIIHDSP